MLKQMMVLGILLLGLITVGCGSGSGSNSGNINGNWKATLTNSDGSPAYSFTTAFTQNGDGTLAVTNLTFTSGGPCLASETTTQSGSVGLSGNFSGNLSGTFGLVITAAKAGASQQNVLTLQGTVNNNTISGNWNLTGESGCNGTGKFVITRT